MTGVEGQTLGIVRATRLPGSRFHFLLGVEKRVEHLGRTEEELYYYNATLRVIIFPRAPNVRSTRDPTMAKLVTLVALVAIFATVSAEVYFEETFDGACLDPRVVTHLARPVRWWV